jgi:phosphohistidine phosphatase
MDLYLIRHADAVPPGAEGIVDDASRPLTELGRVQARSMAAALKHNGVHLDAVITSPLLRAQQTAEVLLVEGPQPKPGLETFDEIGFDVRPKKIVRFLEQLARQSVAIVGHQPGLSRLAAWMIGSKKARLDLDKAGVAKIACDEWDKGRGTLIWLATPHWYK